MIRRAHAPGADVPTIVAPKYVAVAPRGSTFAGRGTAQAAVETFVVHGIPDGPPVTVVVRETGQVLGQNLTLGQAGELVTVETGPITLEVRRAADGVVLRTASFNLTSVEGDVLPILISGFLAPPAGRMVQPVEVTVVTEIRSVGVDGASGPVPNALMLGAAPNPARGTVSVRFNLPEVSHVRLALYDAPGREAAMLVNAEVSASTFVAPLDSRVLAPGVCASPRCRVRRAHAPSGGDAVRALLMMALRQRR